jgi:hypothetical protein
VKTNISVDLNPKQLGYLATLIDGKVTKRQATRKDVTNLVEQFIGATVAQAEYSAGKAGIPEDQASYNPQSDLYQVDQADRKFLDGKDPSYIRGWNQVKRSRK